MCTVTPWKYTCGCVQDYLHQCEVAKKASETGGTPCTVKYTDKEAETNTCCDTCYKNWFNGQRAYWSARWASWLASAASDKELTKKIEILKTSFGNTLNDHIKQCQVPGIYTELPQKIEELWGAAEPILRQFFDQAGQGHHQGHHQGGSSHGTGSNSHSKSGSSHGHKSSGHSHSSKSHGKSSGSSHGHGSSHSKHSKHSKHKG